MAALLSRPTESSLYDWRGANAITLITCPYWGQVQPFNAFFFLSSLPRSCGGSLLPLRWWQVPSEVFNHLSCKTPFNWNYPLADKLLEPYRGGDIVVRVFHAGRFCSCLLLSLFFLLSFSLSSILTPRSVSFFFQLDDLLFFIYCFFLFLLPFFPVWKLPSRASCAVVEALEHEPVSTFLLICHLQTNEPLWGGGTNFRKIMLVQPKSPCFCVFKSISSAAVSSFRRQTANVSFCWFRHITH